MDVCIICAYALSAAEACNPRRIARGITSGRLASFHRHCFGSYLRAEGEQPVRTTCGRQAAG